MRQRLTARLREHHLADDDTFDDLFPDWAHRVSRGNWTPLDVARRAAELLVAEPGMRVLDVGSGVGKVCLVGALTTEGVFHGVEQRAHFVKAARAAALRLGVHTVRFTCADMTTIDWSGHDSIYLFNPFAEYFDRLLQPFEDGAGVDLARHATYVQFVVAQLERARLGTRVVTYNGFGGEFPQCFRQELTESAGDGRLELWVKRT